MGTLDAVLHCISFEDLGYLLEELARCSEAPRSTKERVALVKQCLASGRLDFLKDVIGITKGQKDWLEEMCEAAGVDAAGTIPVLRGRLAEWYDSNLPSGHRPSDVKDGAPHVSTNLERPAVELAAVNKAERQFIEVTTREGDDSLISAAIGAIGSAARIFNQALGATRVLRVHTRHLAGATFERGHPQDGSVYALDPFTDSHYLLAAEAARRIAEQKIAALTVIAGCLGATRVEVVSVKSGGRTTQNTAEIEFLGREVGLAVAMSGTSTSADRIGVEWETSEVRPIPVQYMPYLESMPDLKAVADMVQAGRAPSNMQRHVRLDFRESQEIRTKVGRLASVGSAGLTTARDEFETTEWVFGIWFARVHVTPAPGVPTYAQLPGSGPYTPISAAGAHGFAAPVAIPGAPCPMCHMALVWIAHYQRWFCSSCQRYA